MLKILEEFRNQTSHWQFLNGFFKPEITRFFISWFALTPIVVKITQNMPSTICIPVGENFIPIEIHLPFRWELLWFASLAYAVAFVLYIFLCPGFVKRYTNYNVFLDRGHSPRWLVWEVYRTCNSLVPDKKHLFQKTLIGKGYANTCDSTENNNLEPQITKEGTQWVFNLEGSNYKIIIGENFDAQRQKDLFWEIFGSYSSKKVYFRWIIWILLLVSAILVFCIVVQDVCFVLRNI